MSLQKEVKKLKQNNQKKKTNKQKTKQTKKSQNLMIGNLFEIGLLDA